MTAPHRCPAFAAHPDQLAHRAPPWAWLRLWLLARELARDHHGLLRQVLVYRKIGAEYASRPGLIFDDGGQILLWQIDAEGDLRQDILPKRVLRWQAEHNTRPAEIVCGRDESNLRLRASGWALTPTQRNSANDIATRQLWHQLQRLPLEIGNDDDNPLPQAA